jgi:hypothetical protein
MTDRAPDAKVLDQSFGLDGGGEDVVLALDVRPMWACVARIEQAMEDHPVVAERVRGLVLRAEKGVEAIGTVRVVRCFCGCGQVTMEVHPTQDLLDFVAEIEAAG